jgi:hypothetical protein
MEPLTQKRLKKLLHYDSNTGIFTRITAMKGVSAGDVAGCKNKNGYISIGIDYKEYLGHRLAWFYVHGYFPEHGLDHKDRVRHHNWILNLREASQQCNMRNTGNRKDNKSGVNGVSWCSSRTKWLADIRISGKTKSLGRYNSFCNAVCARLAGEQCINWSGCDSSSPAFKYVQQNVIL